MKCLIAEDHELSHRIMKELFSPLFSCDIAVNGQETIDSFVQAHETKNPYDVLFLDIMMPKVTGLEALRTIRHLERSMEIPAALRVKVIMTTSVSNMHAVVESFKDCEADAYIIKPLSKQKLFKELQTLALVP